MVTWLLPAEAGPMTGAPGVAAMAGMAVRNKINTSVIDKFCKSADKISFRLLFKIIANLFCCCIDKKICYQKIEQAHPYCQAVQMGFDLIQIPATVVTPLSLIKDGSFAPSGYPKLAFSVVYCFH
jgi:hypothetical protein